MQDRSPTVHTPAVAAVVFTMLGSLPLFLVAAQSTAIRNELGFGTSALGFAVSAFFITAALGSSALGPVVDRRGPTTAFRAAALSAAVSGLVLGVGATSWWILVLGLGIAGLANALAQLGANLAIAGGVRDRRQGLVFGAKQAAVPLGSLLAGIVVSVFGLSGAWRETMLFAAVASAALAFGAPRLPHAPSQPGIEPTRGWWRPLLPLVLAAGFAASAGNSLAVLLVDAFVGAGFSPRTAASILAIGSAASVAARVGTGWYVDRAGSGGFRELIALLFAGAAGFSLLVIGGDNAPILVAGALFAFASAWGYPAVVYYVAVRMGSGAPAAATGIVLAGTYTGTVVGPPLLATVAEAGSYRVAWGIGATMMAMSGAIALAASRRSTHASATAMYGGRP